MIGRMRVDRTMCGLVLAVAGVAAAGAQPAVPRSSAPAPSPAGAATDALRFDELVELAPADARGLQSAAATGDRVYLLLRPGPSRRHEHGFTLLVIDLDGRASLRAAVPVEVQGFPPQVQLRAVDDGVEVMATGTHAIQLLRWSDVDGWRELDRLPVRDGTASWFAGGWLALARHVQRNAEDGWVLDGRDHTTLVMPGGEGVYAGAAQGVDRVVASGVGAVVLVSDSTSEDGRAVGWPGRTRAVVVARGRVTELVAPFPWREMPAQSLLAVAGGPRAALIRRRRSQSAIVDEHGFRPTFEDTSLVVVDDVGRVQEFAAPFRERSTLRWFDDVVVAWDRWLGGWTWTPGTGAVQPIPLPLGAPRGWATDTVARLGDELCAWGGEVVRPGGAVGPDVTPSKAAVCVTPRTGATRLLAADPPRQWTSSGLPCPGSGAACPQRLADCRVLADGERAILLCHDDRPEHRRTTLWTVRQARR